MRKFTLKHSRKIIYAIFAIAALWGIGRAYFLITDGFREANIQSELPPSPTRVNSGDESQARDILKQPFHYLAKGCQAYCFISDDGKYVLKFFKYQRYQTSPFITPFTFIPSVNDYVQKRQQHKLEKLEFFMQAWIIANNHLKEESGLVYVHLSKSKHLNQPIVFFDKMGFRHELEADNLEFLIQRTAEPLQKVISKSSSQDSIKLIDQLIDMLVHEYSLGLGDHDPALLQNTGVYNGKPFHIDVGQFYFNPQFKEPKGFYQDLFNRTYEMREWLKRTNPEVEKGLTQKLKKLMGDDFEKMKPYFGRFRD